MKFSRVRLVLYAVEVLAVVALKVAWAARRRKIKPAGSQVNHINGAPVVKLGDGPPAETLRKIHRKKNSPQEREL